MSIKNELAKILGKDYVSDKKEDLAGYAHDHSLLPPGMPDAVVWPGNTQEVGKVVTWCNEKNIPVVPVSSKVHFHGSTIPKQGGVVVEEGPPGEMFDRSKSERTRAFLRKITDLDGNGNSR